MIKEIPRSDDPNREVPVVDENHSMPSYEYAMPAPPTTEKDSPTPR
jgi:hypothetical protein